MHTLVRASVVGVTALMILACGSGEADPVIPTLDSVSQRADQEIDLVDRSEVLADALDYDQADEGDGIDFDRTPAGFDLEVNGEAITSANDGIDTVGGSYTNFRQAAAAVVVADLITLGVVLPPALAIHITAQGTITQLEPNVWYAENTIQLDEQDVTGHLTVAWVGVGWLAEMRYSTEDGVADQTLWFNGFLSYGAAVGWWDFYTAEGDLAGVVEWIADGQGDAQFGIGITAGENAGDHLGYVFFEDTAFVEAYDASADELAWGFIAADHSGELRLPDYNGGEVACWDADLLNADCPAVE